MAEMLRTDAELIQKKADTLNDRSDRARRPSNSNPTIITPGIGFEDTQQDVIRHNEKASIATNDMQPRPSLFPPISPKSHKNMNYASAEPMVAVNDKISKRASLNKGLITLNVTNKEETQKTAAATDDLSHMRSDISTSKVQPQLSSPQGNSTEE